MHNLFPDPVDANVFSKLSAKGTCKCGSHCVSLHMLLHTSSCHPHKQVLCMQCLPLNRLVPCLNLKHAGSHLKPTGTWHAQNPNRSPLSLRNLKLPEQQTVLLSAVVVTRYSKFVIGMLCLLHPPTPAKLLLSVMHTQKTDHSRPGQQMASLSCTAWCWGKDKRVGSSWYNLNCPSAAPQTHHPQVCCSLLLQCSRTACSADLPLCTLNLPWGLGWVLGLESGLALALVWVLVWAWVWGSGLVLEWGSGLALLRANQAHCRTAPPGSCVF